MKKFWTKQAKEHGFDIKAVNFDPLAEELESYFLEQLIKDKDVVCDMGCGNGRTLLHLAQKLKRARFYGIDFVEEMIDIAEKQKQSLHATNVNFLKLDAMSEDIQMLFSSKFNKVITKRLLINLEGVDRFKAVKNIHAILRKGGIYVMIECFIEPLHKINQIRKALSLEEIRVKHFNEYLDCKFLEKICSLFKIERKIDFGSLYYFTSRIYNAYLSKGKPDYFAPINKLTVKITKMGLDILQGYSPEVIFVLKKK